MESEAINNLQFSNTPWSSMMHYALWCFYLKKHPHKKSCNSKVQIFPMTFGKRLECVFSLYKWASQVVQWGKKYLPADAGDTRDRGWSPGSGRSPGEGHSNSFQYSCLKKLMHRGAWWATVHGITQELDTTEHTHTHTHTHTHYMNIHIHTTIYMQIDK